MRVTAVELENIKSYGTPTTRISLGPGVNAILGENGSGKSTIEEAVGYALFDSHPFSSQEHLVRDGESYGVVKVSFISERDNNEYTVVRYAGQSRYEVVDATSNEALALETKAEVVEWIHTHLGVDQETDLSTLWETSIGVAQTRFLSAFAQTQTAREETFDPLLEVDYYRTVWKKLKDLPKKLAADRDQLESEIDRLDGQLERLPAARQEAADQRECLAELTDRLERVREDLATAEEEYEDLDAIANDVAALEADVDRVTDHVRGKREALATAEAERDAAQEAADILDRHQAKYEQHQAAQGEFETLEERRTERDALRDQQAALETEETRLETEHDQLVAAVKTAQTANERITELTPKVERYEELTEKIEGLETDQDRIQALEERLDEIETDIAETERDRERVANEIDRIEEQRELAATLNERREALTDLQARQRQLQSEQTNLEEKLHRLRNLDVNEGESIPCPTCDRSLTGEHRQEVIRQKAVQLEEIADDLETLTEREPALRTAVAEAEEARQQVNRLPDLRDQRDAYSDELASLEADREARLEEKRELEDRVESLPALRTERDDLDGVVDDFRTATTRYEDNEDAVDELEGVARELETVRADLDSVAADLDEYRGLDDEIEAVKQTLRETRDAYNTYLQHEAKASELEQRDDAVERLDSDLQSLEAELQAVETELDEARATFDEERYEALEGRIDSLDTEETRLETQRGGTESQLETVEAEIETLEAKAREKAEAEVEVRELERDERFASFVREKFDDAGPKMREVITNRISQRANAIYQTLRGTAAETLTWDQTYQIVVRVAGREKPFEALSGGEKMAAVLAVRLAILERLTTMGIAFLDEPTANLDREKRQNLVRQLGDLEGFEQLIVISHDDTFESVTEYTTLLEKPESTDTTEVVDTTDPVEAADD